MTVDDPAQCELTLNRFRRLITELVRRNVKRTTFQPWEVDLLVDIESCSLEPNRHITILRQYERAVTRQIESAGGLPIKLSEYLQRNRTRRPSNENPPDKTMRIASE